MKRIIIVTIAFLSNVVICHIYGSDISHTECDLITPFVDSRGIISLDRMEEHYNTSIYKTLYPIGAVHLALQELQAYCCNTHILGGDYCPSTPLSSYLHSYHLYDHLVNIGIRRMDGIPSLLHGRDDLLDPDATSWRTRITERGNDFQGTPPAYILNEYKQRWHPSDDDITNDASPVIAGNIKSINCNNLTHHESLKLKLEQQCSLSHCIMSHIMKLSSLAGNGTTYEGSQERYHGCKELIHNRILSEIHTTHDIINHQANTLFHEIHTSYLQTYFVDTRTQTLLEKLTKQLSLLSIINAKYTEGTRICN